MKNTSQYLLQDKYKFFLQNTFAEHIWVVLQNTSQYLFDIMCQHFCITPSNSNFTDTCQYACRVSFCAFAENILKKIISAPVKYIVSFENEFWSLKLTQRITSNWCHEVQISYVLPFNCSEIEVRYGILRKKHKRNWTKNTHGWFIWIYFVTFWFMAKKEVLVTKNYRRRGFKKSLHFGDFSFEWPRLPNFTRFHCNCLLYWLTPLHLL